MNPVRARDEAISLYKGHDRGLVDEEICLISAVMAYVDGWVGDTGFAHLTRRHNAVRAAALRDLGYGWRQICNLLERGDHASLITAVAGARAVPDLAGAIDRAVNAGQMARGA